MGAGIKNLLIETELFIIMLKTIQLWNDLLNETDHSNGF